VPLTTNKGTASYQSSKYGALFLHCEWNAAAVAAFRSNHTIDLPKGDKTGSMGHTPTIPTKFTIEDMVESTGPTVAMPLHAINAY